MQENSFLPSEEPQEQHQGEGAQGILWRNLLSSINQLFIVRSSWNLVGISHSWFSTSFVKETFLSNHQRILENNIQVTHDKEHLRKKIFLCKSIKDNDIGDLCVIHSNHQRTSGTTSRWRCTRNIVMKSSFFNFSATYGSIIVIFCEHLLFLDYFKFCKWDISLQPLGDPREQHPGEA